MLKWFPVAVLSCGMLVMLFFNDPTVSSRFPKCPFHQTTGLHCPGCGTTRAMHQLVHGNVLRGLSYNPILGLAFPVLACLVAEYLNRTGRFRVPLIGTWPRTMAPWILWVVLGYAVMRNLPYYPFTLLAPNPG